MPVSAPSAASPRRFRAALPLAFPALLALLPACNGGSGGPGGKDANSPTVAAAQPNSGRPGDLVALAGTGLQDTSGAALGTALIPTFRVDGDTRLVARIPPGTQPGAGTLTVFNPDGSAAIPFTVLPVTPAPPTLTGFSPAAGWPGTEVNLYGTGLEQITSVDFNGRAVDGQDVWEVGSGHLVVTIPAGAETGPITVTTPGGLATTAESFVVASNALTLLPPTLTGFTPAAGAAGSRVVLAGSGLALATQVNFGGVASRDFLAPDANGNLSVRVPAGVSGPVQLQVVTPGGIATGAGTFTVTPATAPGAIDSETSSAGDPVTQWTFNGSGFLRTLQVFIGGVPAPDFSIDSDTQLTVTLPEDAVTGPIAVRTPDNLFVGPLVNIPGSGTPPAGLPVVTGFALAPTSSRGIGVILTGSGFTGADAVFFGDVAAESFLEESDTQILALLPPNAVSGVISVVAGAGLGDSSGMAGGGAFTVPAAVPPQPTINVFPAAAQVGDTIPITGSGFTGATQVVFTGNASAQPTVNSDGDLAVPVPAGAQTGPITVVAPGGQVTSGQDLTINPPAQTPTFSGKDVASGPAGTLVTITGANLDSVLAVTFGGQPANFYAGQDGRTVVAEAPAGLPAGTPVPVALRFPYVITPPADQSLGAGAFTLTVAPAAPGALAITAVNPPMGIPGTLVTLTGTGFAGLTQPGGLVAYAGNVLPRPRWNPISDTRIQVLIPDGATTGGDLQVTVPSPAGLVSVHAPFLLLLSRLSLFRLPFATETFPGVGTLLDFPHRQRTDQYQQLHLPQSPVFHAYNPIPNGPAGAPGPRPGVVPTFTLNMVLPPAFYPMLPPDLTDRIARLGLAQSDVDIRVVSQNYAYDGISGDNGIYLFRPHYWTDPDAPDVGRYWEASRVGAGLFGQAAGISFTGRPPQTFYYDNILVHGPSRTTSGQVLSSTREFPVTGLTINQSTAFWSLAALNDRAVATLHLFLSDADQNRLSAIASSLEESGGMLGLFAVTVATTNWSPTGQIAFRQVLALFGPNVAQPALRAPNGATDVITLQGSSMTLVTGATLNTPAGSLDSNLGDLTIVSDAVLQVTVPAGATGNLVLHFAAGDTAPIALP